MSSSYPMSSSYQEGAPPRAPRVSLHALAEAKKLPLSFLRQLFLVDLDNNAGIGIPYFDLAGDKIAVKRRTSLIAKEGSFWQANTPLAAYGQWRFHEAAKSGRLILVEGESDCWTLWHHGYPATACVGEVLQGGAIRRGSAGTRLGEVLQKPRVSTPERTNW